MESSPDKNNPSLGDHKNMTTEILEECRTNSDLYDSPSGIDVSIGGVNWTITYWPEYGDSPEKLTITRGTDTYNNPVSYSLSSDGIITKNTTIERRVSEGVFFDSKMSHIVEDVQELELIKAIVIATHETHR